MRAPNSLLLLLALTVPACFSDPLLVDGGEGGETGALCDGELDECGVCNGPGGPCFGCTVPQASNYDELAMVDDGTCSCTAAGNPVADQAQLESDGGAGGLEEWQSFTPAIGGGLARVSLEVGSPLDPEPSPGTLAIHAGEGPAGTMLGSVEVVLQPGFPSMQTFELPNPIPLAAEEVYTIRLTVPEQTSGYVKFQSGDPYSRGQSADPSQDMVFRTEMVACTPDP
ncbi:hypothetical protein ENSA5_68900 [Enhygromyxa salina]|uniref:Uncharacterized protein n=1 Tax=Enhygromyxa salina TaxID=215803 RepID=A0A2S9XAY0_9BACT|nr:hypothetical protein [Enhygromyxa salina]PRP90008.1 hypothetical protein ENSA5_68900 [Enhygromyxa salina]